MSSPEMVCAGCHTLLAQHALGGRCPDGTGYFKRDRSPRPSGTEPATSPDRGEPETIDLLVHLVKSLNNDRIKAIEARANAATPGPWEWGRTYEMPDEDGYLHKHWALHNRESSAAGRIIAWPLVTLTSSPNDFDGKPLDQTPDFQFIAHAREDIPFLIAALRSSPPTATSEGLTCAKCAYSAHAHSIGFSGACNSFAAAPTQEGEFGELVSRFGKLCIGAHKMAGDEWGQEVEEVRVALSSKYEQVVRENRALELAGQKMEKYTGGCWQSAKNVAFRESGIASRLTAGSPEQENQK